MSGEDLRVMTAHLGELAVRQAEAAAGTRSAMRAVAGVDGAVAVTHGSIASPSTHALGAVLASRDRAGTTIADLSDALCDKLTGAAKRYDRADGSMAGALDAQLRPES